MAACGRKLIHRARRIAALGVLVAATGCVEVVGFPNPTRTDVAVRTAHSVIHAETFGITDFRVAVEITNLGPRWVVYDRWCGWRIDQLVNNRWVTAYEPFCTIYSSEHYWVPPGATYYEVLPAHASWRAPTGGRLEGTYRVVYAIYEEIDVDRHDRIRQERTTSNSFVVR